MAPITKRTRLRKATTAHQCATEMNYARLSYCRDVLLVVVLLLNIMLYVRQMSTVCPCEPATSYDISEKLREFTKTIEQKLRLKLSPPTLVEAEMTIDGQLQQKLPNGTEKLKTPDVSIESGKIDLEIDRKFAQTDNVMTCEVELQRVTKFSQVWSHQGAYQGCAETEILKWATALASKERKVFSQFGEDGVIEEIFKRIGSGNKLFAEFGVESGMECLTRNLRQNHGWTGIMFDNAHSNPSIGLHQASIWVDNILNLFDTHKISRELDFLVIDTDFGDFWLLEKLLSAGYRPRVIAIEINNNHGPYAALTVPLKDAQAHGHWKGNKFFGTSVNAVYKLASNYGYEYVYLSKEAVNAFFVLRSELSNVNLAQLHWSGQLATTSRMLTIPGHGLHAVDKAHNPFVHICAMPPCVSTHNY